MIVRVIVQPYRKTQVRVVEVPDEVVQGMTDERDVLEMVFQYGQNEFQVRQCPSVSVGDFVLLNDSVWVVEPTGFDRLENIG